MIVGGGCPKPVSVSLSSHRSIAIALIWKCFFFSSKCSYLLDLSGLSCEALIELGHLLLVCITLILRTWVVAWVETRSLTV